MMLGNRTQREAPVDADDLYPGIVGTPATTGHQYVANPVVTMPASIAAGDFLVCLFGCTTVSTITVPAGWTEVGQHNASGSATIVVCTRIATGTDSLTMAMSPTRSSKAIVYRVARADACNATFGNGSDSAIDFPSNTATPASGYYTNFLFMINNGGTMEAYPSGFGDLVSDTGGGGACVAQGLYKEDSSRVENPASVALSGTTSFAMANVAVYNS